MKRAYLITALFILLITALVYNISEANKKVDNFFRLHKDISTITATNKNFDIFTSSTVNYTNFDVIQKDIINIDQKIHSIIKNPLFEELHQSGLQTEFLELREILQIKISILEKLKSHSAVLNNSYRNIKKLLENIPSFQYVRLYSDIISVEHNPEASYDGLEKKINELMPFSPSEELFVTHSKVIINKSIEFEALKQKITDLKLETKLNAFEVRYSNYSQTIIKEFKNIIWLLIILLTVSMIAFLLYSYAIIKKQIELNRFKSAVENSDNIILITDKNKKIKYVNQSFLRTTGYALEEVIGKNPSMLKSGFVTNSFYKEMNETIYAGKQWTGEFANVNKAGKLCYEKASITPILDEDGEIQEFLGMKLDITHEKETQKELKEKEHLIAQQSKMTAMREMLESIAHQWRQPLSTISTAASGLKLNKEYGALDDEKFENLTDAIVDNTVYLSDTIDNFKSFFRTSNEITLFNIKESFKKVFELIGYKLKDEGIEYNVESQEILLVEGLENDLIQAFLNIINNAKDAFSKIENQKKYIFINVEQKDDDIVIEMKDNAGGIPKDIIDHIFEPYFTTKHESQGTGMGLFMTHEIIAHHFYGIIVVQNCNYTYKEEECQGTKITITIPTHMNSLNHSLPII